MPNESEPSVFDKKCAEVARRLDMTIEEVVAVFDTYDDISAEWAKLKKALV